MPGAIACRRRAGRARPRNILGRPRQFPHGTGDSRRILGRKILLFREIEGRPGGSGGTARRGRAAAPGMEKKPMQSMVTTQPFTDLNLWSRNEGAARVAGWFFDMGLREVRIAERGPAVATALAGRVRNETQAGADVSACVEGLAAGTKGAQFAQWSAGVASAEFGVRSAGLPGAEEIARFSGIVF